MTSLPGDRDPGRRSAEPVVSLELLLDDETDTRVRAEWSALAEAGFSSLAGHTAASNRPHITLLVRGAVADLPAQVLADAVSLPLPITLGAPVLFGAGDRRILARSIIPSEALLTFHARIHALAGPAATPTPSHPGGDAPHTRPGEWTPHVTLARRLRLVDLPRALELLDELNPDSGSGAGSGWATTLRRWDAASATVTDIFGR